MIVTARATQPILLIEDDLSLRDSLCGFLEDHGYRTLSAASCAEGWKLLLDRQARLCLLDLNLPDGSGFDLLKQMAKQGLSIQVIVMTAFDLAHLRPAGVTHLLAGWLTKPVHPAELLEAIERVLGEDPCS